jgi:hypothetical protein
MTPNEIITQAVDKFLPWKLPQHFHPDSFISFDGSKHDTWGGYPNSWPTGTNLFTAEQARGMFEYCLLAAVEAQSKELEAAKTTVKTQAENNAELLRTVRAQAAKLSVLEAFVPDCASWDDAAPVAQPAPQQSIKIPTETMEQEFQNHYRRGYEAGKLAQPVAPQQEPVGYYNEGTAPHTRGKIEYHKEPTKNLETRWWTEDKPLYAQPACLCQTRSK